MVPLEGPQRFECSPFFKTLMKSAQAENQPLISPSNHRQKLRHYHHFFRILGTQHNRFMLVIR